MRRFGHLLAVSACAGAALVAAPPAQADFCELSWDIPCCPIPNCEWGVAMATLTICNCEPDPTGVATTYRFMMEDKSGCMPAALFYPATGSVTLAPGECVDLAIKVFCPPREACPDNCVIFSANVINTITGNALRCDGKAVLVENFKVTPNGGVNEGGQDDPVVATLTVGNIGSSGKDGVALDFQPMGPVEVLSPQPGTVIPVLPGDSMNVPLVVRFAPPKPVSEGAPPPLDPMAQVLILWDDNGDGAPEVNSSAAFRFLAPESCPTDLNGDGKTDGADLGLLLQGWGPCPGVIVP